jgi:hypothetical protein
MDSARRCWSADLVPLQGPPILRQARADLLADGRLVPRVRLPHAGARKQISAASALLVCRASGWRAGSTVARHTGALRAATTLGFVSFAAWRCPACADALVPLRSLAVRLHRRDPAGCCRAGRGLVWAHTKGTVRLLPGLGIGCLARGRERALPTAGGWRPPCLPCWLAGFIGRSPPRLQDRRVLLPAENLQRCGRPTTAARVVVLTSLLAVGLPWSLSVALSAACEDLMDHPTSSDLAARPGGVDARQPVASKLTTRRRPAALSLVLGHYFGEFPGVPSRGRAGVAAVGLLVTRLGRGLSVAAGRAAAGR